MNWWCSATGQAWDWSWRAYPGVWLFVLAIGALYWRAARPETPQERRRALLFGAAGLLPMWLVLDWPVGPLGAGYFVSVHALQFLVLAFLVPPLLLNGISPDRWRLLERRARAGLPGRIAAHPLVTGVLFNVVVLTTHLPRVVDDLMARQLGAFAIDVAWLGAGLLFWRPIVSPQGISPALGRIAYLFAGTLVHTALGMWLLLSRSPVYGVYELAPPLAGRSAMVDQGLAGGVMELLGAIVVIGSIAVIFFRWAAAESESRPATAPADGGLAEPGR